MIDRSSESGRNEYNPCICQSETETTTSSACGTCIVGVDIIKGRQCVYIIVRVVCSRNEKEKVVALR